MKKKYIIGIDLGGTNLKIALLNLNYKIAKKEIISTKRFAKKESLIQGISDAINKIIRKNNLAKREVLGVGLGLPGPIDHRQGIVHFFPNIPGWREVRLKSILEKKINLPVLLDNDAKLMTLAEYKLGGGRGFKNVLCLTLGTGVGGGIIINEKLYRGQDNAAGEIGHLPINEKGPKCNCGGVACLESYIGNNKILKEARIVFNRKISLEELSALAKKQNKLAKNIWLRAGSELGVALAGIVNLLNPDAIIIGGGVANAGAFLFDRIRATIKKRSMSVQAKRVVILKAKLGSDAGLAGAAILVKNNII